MSEAIDRFVNRAAIRAANSLTRRSFFGRVGGATTALATAGLVLEPTAAMAVCPGASITCNTLYGGNHNYCSENTCVDGSWTVPPGTCDSVAQCGGQRTRWRDCCATSSCGCHYPSGYPSCCNGCIYNGGQNCSSNHTRVRCRYWGCG